MTLLHPAAAVEGDVATSSSSSSSSSFSVSSRLTSMFSSAVYPAKKKKLSSPSSVLPSPTGAAERVSRDDDPAAAVSSSPPSAATTISSDGAATRRESLRSSAHPRVGVATAATANTCTFEVDDDERESLVSHLSAELERERKRRAELEETVAKQLLVRSSPPDAESPSSQPTTTQTHSNEGESAKSSDKSESDPKLLRAKLTRARAERDGLVQLVHAVTSSNDAVRYASKRQNEDKTLPYDTVTLLEIMPWEDSAERYTSAIEEVYEWEMFDRETSSWTGRYRDFPDDFRCVPIVKPSAAASATSAAPTDADGEEHAHFWTQKRREILGGGGDGGEFDSVLTDKGCTRVIDVKGGYPLPSRGTWEWVGEWQVDKQRKRKDGPNVGADGLSSRSQPCCDSEGWSYASQPKLLVWGRVCATAGGDDGASDVVRKFRRRRWTRRRALVSYPSASDMPRHFLALKAENAKLEQRAEGLEEKVAELENVLREREEDMKRVQIRERELRELREEELLRLVAGSAERSGQEVPVAAVASDGRDSNESGASAATPHPKKQRPWPGSMPAEDEHLPTDEGKERNTLSAAKGPNTSMDNAGASSFLLSEVKGYFSGASALKAMSKLYKINEAAENVHGELPDSGSEQPLHKLISREDGTVGDDAATVPTSAGSSSSSEDDTLSVLSEATRSVEISLPPVKRRTHAIGARSNSSSAAVLDRLLSTVSSTAGATHSAGVIDLDGFDDDDVSIQVGKEIYCVTSEAATCANKEEQAREAQKAQLPVQVLPFSSPTIRFSSS